MDAYRFLFVPKGFNTQEPACAGELQGEVVDLTLMLAYANTKSILLRRSVMQNITKLQRGERGVIARLDGDARFLSRITAIGLTPGCPVEILRSEKRQPVLLYSRDTIIALSRREGEKIMLEVSV
jgi:ferrous iron transport protein A